MRATIYLSGCPHHCPGCHNPDAQSPDFGQFIDTTLIHNIAHNIAIRPFLSGITLSGGDPFFNPSATYLFVCQLFANYYTDYIKINKAKKFPNLWIYTGYTWEELINKSDIYVKALIFLSNVLVDGPFLQQYADKTLPFRGSSNQRIIDVRKSLKENKVILFSKECL